MDWDVQQGWHKTKKLSRARKWRLMDAVLDYIVKEGLWGGDLEQRPI